MTCGTAVLDCEECSLPGLTSIAAPVLGPSKSIGELLLRIAGVVGFAMLTALLARVAWPLPGSSVPMTLQSLGVLVCAFGLGGRLGAVSMGVYVIAGALGAPVFADGASGWSAVWGSSTGYLVGFVVAQPVIAAVARGPGKAGEFRSVIAAGLLGHVVILGCGVVGLMVLKGMSVGPALDGGAWPYLPGAIVKSGLAVFPGMLLVPWAMQRGW